MESVGAETAVAHVDAAESEVRAEDLKADEVSFKPSKVESLKGEGEELSGDKEEMQQQLESNGGDKTEGLVEKEDVAGHDGQVKQEGEDARPEASEEAEGHSAGEGCESKSTSEAEKSPDSDAVKIQPEDEANSQGDSQPKDADLPEIHQKQDGEAGSEEKQKHEVADAEVPDIVKAAEDSDLSHSAPSSDDSSIKCHSTCSTNLCEKQGEEQKANVDSEVSPAS
jgi:hypothetical protein